ncbi:GNAT family N-acetyltransferase [Halomonas elongata]|nr:GNAT family N-acetyltransferase [Halomonas elongata]MBW5799952.1 GNAT family N-acetyltransferase [Halomonas elongata]MDL4863574.1 GNAT family N-acetyltransferase [Halomonas elongata]OBX33819.1 acetyltransferase YpeA [Halomonas elongata]WBF16839.1 GNAT family N-acetyltransferase [Halomonas elongata]WPU45670.1 GNAT family N-acetyltransferase [Halomonas elongata DSM 2581]
MTPRKYTEDDEPRVAALWRANFPDYTGYNTPEAVLRAKRLVDDHIYVLEDDGEIIATCMAGYDGHRGWLYSVAVAASRQGEGLGRRMVEFAIERLRELGCVKVNLQIRGGNEEVADFYRRLGFNTEDRISMGLILDP